MKDPITGETLVRVKGGSWMTEEKLEKMRANARLAQKIRTEMARNKEVPYFDEKGTYIGPKSPKWHGGPKGSFTLNLGKYGLTKKEYKLIEVLPFAPSVASAAKMAGYRGQNARILEKIGKAVIAKPRVQQAAEVMFAKAGLTEFDVAKYIKSIIEEGAKKAKLLAKPTDALKGSEIYLKTTGKLQPKVEDESALGNPYATMSKEELHKELDQVKEMIASLEDYSKPKPIKEPLKENANTDEQVHQS